MDNEMIFSDKEYVIMSEIEENNTLTQRDLSSKLGVSVSTVNLLLNKMLKEGLIKINHVSKRQVLYMLTPKGILEKAHKTTRYLKGHYRIIFETKEKIKALLSNLEEKHDAIFILIPEDELGEIIKIAVAEYQLSEMGAPLISIEDSTSLPAREGKNPVLLYAAPDPKIPEALLNLQRVSLVNYL